MLGLPGLAYTHGFFAGWLAYGLLAGNILSWSYCAKRLRTFSITNDNAITIPEYLSRRLKDPHNVIQTVAALAILLFFLFYASSGFVSAGKILSSFFGISYDTALIAGALSIIIYTYMGGFLGAAWADLFQGTIMMIGLLLVVFVTVESTSGVAYFHQAVARINEHYFTPLTQLNNQPYSLVAILSLVAWGLG